MSGRIKEEDVTYLRERVPIDEVVADYVQLKSAGGGQKKGLCPFHDEKSPSFHVTPSKGFYHCFGCQASGDVISFLMKMDHLTFTETLERLADRIGYTLRYEENSSGPSVPSGMRSRLIAANAAAATYYQEQLNTSPDAAHGRDLLMKRGFDKDACKLFGVGFAPDDWDSLTKHLRAQGFTIDELETAGLSKMGQRGPIDRFRNRLTWPIKDITGDVVGFGCRKLASDEEDQGPKYLNTPETPIYKKSQVLYGLDVAKKEIAKKRQAVIVEGYTDVMAAHLAGITTAVATCGTALTEDHVKLMKRYARNVVLAFDADAAGQGATDKFYAWEKKYDISVSVAQFPAGKDPGELASSDPEALTRAINDAMPFLGFRLKRLFDANPLRSPESRARLAGKAMELVNEHPDSNVRRLYAGQVASHTGVSAADLVKVADRGGSAPVVIAAPVQQATEGAGFVALSLLIHEWDTIAPWLIEELFPDDASREAFRAIAASDGDVHVALQSVQPDAADIIERAAVYDIDADPLVESRALIAAAVRRELSRRRLGSDIEQIQNDRTVRNALEDLNKHDKAPTAAVILLQWLAQVAQAAT